jgi:hypothetical protein
MLSGFDDEPLLVTAMKLDTSGFIKKSVSKNELVARMNSIFMGETKIKSIEEYQKVTLPSIEGAFRHESPSIKKSASAIRLPANIKSKAVRTPLEKITPGSLVADDIVTASGNIILSEGDKVTNQLIEFLVQTKDITKISTLLVVNL